MSSNELVIVAVRPEYAEVRPVLFEVREAWAAGRDLHDLGLEDHGCFLVASSWHAQIGSASGDLGAERLDVDRRKDRSHIVHRHPLGQPNQVRVPAASLRHPEAWVAHVEELIADYYGY